MKTLINNVTKEGIKHEFSTKYLKNNAAKKRHYRKKI